MKQIIFLITLIFSANLFSAQVFAEGLFRSADFYSCFEAKVPPQKGENSAFKTDTGIRLIFSHLNLISSATIPSDPLKFHWGAKAHLSPKSFLFNADLLSGTLHFSQGISRLKSPALTVPSALHKSTFLNPGISPSLPSFTDSVKPISFSLCLSPKEKNPFLPEIQLAYTLEGEWYACTFKNFSLSFIPNASLSFTMGSFRYGSKAFASWFSQSPYFPKRNNLALEAEANLIFSSLRFSSAFGLSEFPFGGVSLWLKNYLSFISENFCAHGAFFISDKDLYAADGSQGKTYMQAQFNPQVFLRIQGIPFSTGLVFHADFCRSRTRENEYYQQYTFRFDSSLGQGKWQLKFFNGMKFLSQDNSFSFTSKTSLSLKNKKIASLTSTSLAFEEKTITLNFSESLSPSLAKRNSFGIAKASLSEKIIFKNTELNSSQTDLSLALSGKIGKLKLNFDLSFVLPIKGTAASPSP